MTAANEKPLPCPFCGQVPTAIEADTSQGYKWGSVICCIRGPEVRTHYKTDSSWHAAAIEAWNERRPQTAEAVDEDKEREAYQKWLDRQRLVQYPPNNYASTNWPWQAWLARARGGN